MMLSSAPRVRVRTFFSFLESWNFEVGSLGGSGCPLLKFTLIH